MLFHQIEILITIKVLLVPTMIVYKKDVQDRIIKFVENGGTVVFTFRTAVKDYYNNLTLNELNPTFYTELIGGFVEEIESLQEGQSVNIAGEGKYSNVNGTGEVFRDMLKTTTAKTLFKYEDEFFNDLSAITVNEYGKGKAYYIGTAIDDNTMDIIASDILKDNQIEYIDSDFGVEIVQRVHEDKKYYFIMNHNNKKAKGLGIELMPYESKIISAEELL